MTDGELDLGHEYDRIPTEAYNKTRIRFLKWIKGWRGHDCAMFYLRVAQQLQRSGSPRIGSQRLIEIVRNSDEVPRGFGAAFKVNNSFEPHLARWAIEQDPKLEGLFELRAMKS
jgi:hypothetical protein